MDDFHKVGYWFKYVNKERAFITILAIYSLAYTLLMIIPTVWYLRDVGTWSMSSRWGNNQSKLRVDGVTWPGGANKPPKGRPNKFKLKVATLKEPPFVIYSKLQDNGNCEAGTIPCRILRDSDELLKTSENVTTQASSKQGASSPPSFLPRMSSNHMKGGNSSGWEYAFNTSYVAACCTGLTMDLLTELMNDLNFEVDLFEVPDKKWGAWTSEGWNGLIRILLDKQADIVVTSLKITPNRSAHVDFSAPFEETGITIAVALREGGISPTAFLEPYSYASWFLILFFSVHACGAALFIYEWLSPHGLDRGSVAISEHKFSLFRSLWLIWSMLFGAAVNADNPRGVASRFLANIWALFALVFLASYTANLAAFMIAKENFYDLEGINDWRLTNPTNHKPPFRFATIPSGATEENIKINYPDMAAYMRNYKKSTVEEGIQVLKAGEIDAFIYDANVLAYMAARDEDCKLLTVGNWYARTGYGVAFQRGSRWLEKFNGRILHYQKSGKLQRWKKFWLTGACKGDGELGNSNKTLGVKNFISAFILLVGGIFICTLFLGLEHAFYRYLRPQIRDWDKYGCCGLVSISMGQLLSFEESVNQTVDLLKHHKCSDPICQTQIIMQRSELAQARRQLNKLETALHKKQAQLEKSKRNCEEVKDKDITIDAAANKQTDRMKNQKFRNKTSYSHTEIAPLLFHGNDDNRTSSTSIPRKTIQHTRVPFQSNSLNRTADVMRNTEYLSNQSVSEVIGLPLPPQIPTPAARYCAAHRPTNLADAHVIMPDQGQHHYLCSIAGNSDHLPGTSLYTGCQHPMDSADCMTTCLTSREEVHGPMVQYHDGDMDVGVLQPNNTACVFKESTPHSNSLLQEPSYEMLEFESCL